MEEASCGSEQETNPPGKQAARTLGAAIALHFAMPRSIFLWTPILVAAFASACSCSSPGKSSGPAASSPAAAPTIVAALPAPRVDTLLRTAWEKQGVAPTAPVDDATFLRRLTLDLWGMLPTPAEQEAFAKESAPDKRVRQIDRMLSDPRFSERFAVVWTDVLLGEASRRDAFVDRAAFRSWLKQRVTEKAPWKAIAHEIIAGNGTNSPGGTIKERAIASHAALAEPYNPEIQGHVNYLLQFRNSVENLTGKTSRSFLGIQIQCAQCHDHKTEAWTMDQFKGLAAAFVHTRGVPVEKRDKGEMRVLEVKDNRRAKPGPKTSDFTRAVAKVSPKALDGTALPEESARKSLADWITAKNNPTFAKAFVNRVWGQFLGSGFVEPVDDFRPGNKPVLPELLDALANGFIESNYDIRGLVRTICTSEAYQRSAGPEAPLWSSFAMRPLPAVVMFDIIANSSGLLPIIEDALGERAELARARTRQTFVLMLDVDEDAGTHTFEGGIPHALLLANGVVSRLAARAIQGGTLLEIIRAKDSDDEKITKLYQRTLSRLPSPEEITQWKKFLDAAPEKTESDSATAKRKGDPLARLDQRMSSKAKTPREHAYEDMFWALLNSSEMAFQH
jgi:Protein of unknown function (DUF1549)/Protein of unknown function (DUF1553)